jgi:hypothetical protein
MPFKNGLDRGFASQPFGWFAFFYSDVCQAARRSSMLIPVNAPVQQNSDP